LNICSSKNAQRKSEDETSPLKEFEKREDKSLDPTAKVLSHGKKYSHLNDCIPMKADSMPYS
jgi:hypothetical protein